MMIPQVIYVCEYLDIMEKMLINHDLNFTDMYSTLDECKEVYDGEAKFFKITIEEIK